MFHNPGMTLPEAYTVCNGFVRPEFGGDGATQPYCWPYSSHTSYPYPNAWDYNPAQYIRSHAPWSVPPVNVWGNMPVYPPRGPDKSFKSFVSILKGSQPSSVTPGQTTTLKDKSYRSLSRSSTSSGLLKSAQYPSDIALHQELQWHHTWTSSSSGLVWDIARPPSVAKTVTPRFIIVNPDFNAPIMHKTIEGFEVWTDHPVLDCYMRTLDWGPVPMPKKKNPTISEFLRAIYEYLYTPLTNEDLEFIVSTPQNFELLEKARKGRVTDGYDAVWAAAVQGSFRRSDVLGSHRRFQGARVAKMGDGTDRLYFNLGSGPIPRI